MAHFFDGGVNLFDAANGSQMHPGTIEFLSKQFNNVSTNLSEAGKRFKEKAKNVFEKAVSSDAMRLARAASRRVRSLWGADEIRPLRDIGEFQHAKINMQRWVMANPLAREYYHEQRLDGYSDTYMDMEPGKRGESHYDFRRVMNGIVQFMEEEGEDGESNWSSVTYFEELHDEDRELEIDEQSTILSSWSYLEQYIRAGKEDPTSVMNADLG